MFENKNDCSVSYILLFLVSHICSISLQCVLMVVLCLSACLPLSIWPHAAILNMLPAFLWELLLESFTKICWCIAHLVSHTTVMATCQGDRHMSACLLSNFLSCVYWRDMCFKQNFCESSGCFEVIKDYFMLCNFYLTMLSRSLSPLHDASLGCSWRNGFQIWRVAVNILNKQMQTADKGWSTSLGFGRGADSSLS